MPMRMPIWTVLTACALIGACRSGGGAAKAPAIATQPTTQTATQSPAAPLRWRIVFSDDFQRARIDKDWMVLDGSWRIEDGWLTGAGEILCLHDAPGDQRVEYDCRAEQSPGDLSAALMADSTGHVSGYFFGFGSENNAYSKITVNGEEVKRHDTLIEPGKVHHVVCQVEGDRLTHVIDGKLCAEYTLRRPITWPGNRMISLYTWTVGFIDNVRIYTKARATDDR